MVVDIKSFFPSVSLDSVVRSFGSFGFPEETASQLGHLCCLEGRLPQGAPTSPALANLVFSPIDESLESLAEKWGCRYTRYADDLAFSGPRQFSQADVASVERILRKPGFSINPQKTRIVGAGGRQIVAGLVVNKKAQPPREQRRLWRAMFHRAAKHPREFSQKINHLAGIASYVNQFDPDLAKSYVRIVKGVVRVSRQK